MALLSNDSRHDSRARSLTIAGLIALGLGGCALLGSLRGGKDRFAFSHRIHAEELECTDCHLGAEDEDVAGIPGLAQCLLCHEEGDEEVPPERRIEALFAEEEFLATNVYALDDEVIFSHPDHASIAPECSACHKGIETSDDVAQLERLSMDSCMNCHETLGISTECSTCHSQLSTQTAPRTHDDNWIRWHGPQFRAGSEAPAQRCDLCHESSSCDACHLIDPPQNHTNYWRQRGHAITSSMDRESCSACHRSDFCNRCHEDAIPMNHTGMWGNARNNHCVTCHFPLKSEGCITCHKGTPSHATAAPLPPDHTPALNCRQCHGLSAPLPHVDNGSQCTLCHR